jgi:hypothetical protein
MGVIPEEDDEEAAEEDKERGAGRMGDLELIAARNEFAAVPEAAGRFHCQDIHSAGNKAYCPAGDPIEQAKAIWHGIYFCVNKVDEYFFVQRECRKAGGGGSAPYI